MIIALDLVADFQDYLENTKLATELQTSKKKIKKETMYVYRNETVEFSGTGKHTLQNN